MTSERLLFLIFMEITEMKQSFEQLRNELTTTSANVDALADKFRAATAAQADVPSQEEVDQVLRDMQALNQKVIALLGV